MKTYRRHRCERNHRTMNAWVRCAMPWAYRVEGEGEWGVVCQRKRRLGPTVDLYATFDEASERGRVDHPYGNCSGTCLGYELIHFVR